MIQTFIEKNRKMLVLYYRVMRIGGWLLLSLASLAAAGHSFALATRIGDGEEFYRYWHHDVPWGTFTHGLPMSLLVLGMAQFIRYLLEPDRKPGWILRNADKLLYVYTAVLIGYWSWRGATDVITHFNEPYDFPLRLILLAAFILVELLLLLGLAEMLRRLLPMIEESRTLV